MEFEKLYPGRGARAVAATATSPVRRTAQSEDTSDTFARMLQNMREAKPANILADGSVVVQIFREGKLISENMTRGSDPEAGKEILSTQVETIAQKADEAAQNPLLASRAAQGAMGAVAAVMNTVM